MIRANLGGSVTGLSGEGRQLWISLSGPLILDNLLPVIEVKYLRCRT
jgi:hypothetical protein